MAFGRRSATNVFVRLSFSDQTLSVTVRKDPVVRSFEGCWGGGGGPHSSDQTIADRKEEIFVQEREQERDGGRERERERGWEKGQRETVREGQREGERERDTTGKT